MRLRIKVTCPNCDGTGIEERNIRFGTPLIVEEVCPECNGEKAINDIIEVIEYNEVQEDSVDGAWEDLMNEWDAEIINVFNTDLDTMYDTFGDDLIEPYRETIEKILNEDVKMSVHYIGVPRGPLRSLLSYAENFSTRDRELQEEIDDIIEKWEISLSEE